MAITSGTQGTNDDMAMYKQIKIEPFVLGLKIRGLDCITNYKDIMNECFSVKVNTVKQFDKTKRESQTFNTEKRETALGKR